MCLLVENDDGRYDISWVELPTRSSPPQLILDIVYSFKSSAG